MIVTVKEYLKETNEISCEIDESEKTFGKIITVDPFVTCAIETTDDNYREVGREMVGNVYEMTEYGINDDHVYCPGKFRHIPSFEVPVQSDIKTPEEQADFILNDMPKTDDPMQWKNWKYRIALSFENQEKEVKSELNEFIGDIAKLLGEDDLGHDGKSWTIDDFKDAIERVKTEAIEENSKEYCKYCDAEIDPTSRLIDGLGRPFCNTSCLSGHQHSKGF